MFTFHKTTFITTTLLAAMIILNTCSPLIVCDDFYWSINKINAVTFYPGSMLGDLAPIVADYLVIQAGQFWHEGRWYLMPVMYGMVVNVQPSYLVYWSLLSWLYAFNNTAVVNNEQQRNILVEKGIKVLQKGLQFHPARYELYFDVAWTYFKKRDDFARALQYLNRSEQYPHPSKVERLKAIVLFRLGRLADARAVWSDYLTAHPESAEARNELRRLEEIT